MNVALIVAGGLFLLWPLQYRRSVRRINERIASRGGDVTRFERSMNRPWIRAALFAAPIVGIVLIVVGATS